MISSQDQATLLQIARKYDVKRVLLFGSGASPGHEGNDIDLAVEGVAPALFFQFYAELIMGLSKPVDLIDLSEESRFNHIVRAEGVPVYG